MNIRIYLEWFDSKDLYTLFEIKKIVTFDQISSLKKKKKKL